MAEVVLSENEISLNAVRYKIVGPVQRSLSSNYPQKTVIGDYTKDSSPILSTLSLTDHRGGIGLDIMEGQGDTNRSWYSTADLRFKGRLVLPPLVTETTGLPSDPAVFTVYCGPLTSFQGKVYAAIYSNEFASYALYRYSGSSWGTALTGGLVIRPSSLLSGYVGGTRYIIMADNVFAYRYSTSGDLGSWTIVTPGGTNYPWYMAIWDDKLWWLSSNGMLWYVTSIAGTPVFAGQLQSALEWSREPSLFVALNTASEEILYVATHDGLFAYDFDNNKFIKTDVTSPDKSLANYSSYYSAARWRNAIFYTAETTVYKYDPVQGTLITEVGPDVDSGLPNTRGSLISHIVASLTDLIIATSGDGSLIPIIAGWDGKGWKVFAELASGEKVTYKSLLVAGAYGDYRVWFASDEGAYIKYFSLPTDLVKPFNDNSYTCAAAATHDWPWFTAGQSEVTKVAVRVKVETVNPTTDETVILSYATDWVESFTSFATIRASGITTFPFPNSTTPTGTVFKSIRFRATLARGGTITNTPQVISVTLEYYKKLDPKYQFLVTIDLTKDYGGRSPKVLRAALLTAQETTTLVEFTYRDPASNSDATFYVQTRPQIVSENTGYDERGQTAMLLVEV